MSTPITRTTIDISGFGGGYEETCQQMLWQGVAYLEAAQPSLSMWEGLRQSRNIIGIATVDNDALRALETAMMAGVDDATGAMHQAVLNHLAWIHRLGVEGWLAKAREMDGEQRVRQWTPRDPGGTD